jgi:hypothetical protein
MVVNGCVKRVLGIDTGEPRSAMGQGLLPHLEWLKQALSGEADGLAQQGEKFPAGTQTNA